MKNKKILSVIVVAVVILVVGLIFIINNQSNVQYRTSIIQKNSQETSNKNQYFIIESSEQLKNYLSKNELEQDLAFVERMNENFFVSSKVIIIPWLSSHIDDQYTVDRIKLDNNRLNIKLNNRNQGENDISSMWYFFVEVDKSLSFSTLYANDIELICTVIVNNT